MEVAAICSNVDCHIFGRTYVRLQQRVAKHVAAKNDLFQRSMEDDLRTHHIRGVHSS